MAKPTQYAWDKAAGIWLAMASDGWNSNRKTSLIAALQYDKLLVTIGKESTKSFIEQTRNIHSYEFSAIHKRTWFACNVSKKIRIGVSRQQCDFLNSGKAYASCYATQSNNMVIRSWAN